MNLKRAEMLLLMFIPLTQLTGCTGMLWEDDRFTRYHCPADPPNVRLFQANGARDVLVQYDEKRQRDKLVHPRAYWAERNVMQTNTGRKPAFANPREAQGLASIPIVPSPGADWSASSAACYACLSTNGNAFVLYRVGEQPATNELPRYFDSKMQRAKQVALTPAAVVVDASVVGALAAFLITVFSNGADLNYLATLQH